MLYLLGKRHHEDGLKFASIDGIPLHNDNRSSVSRLRSLRVLEIDPKNITLADYHSSSISWTALIVDSSSARFLSISFSFGSLYA